MDQPHQIEVRSRFVEVDGLRMHALQAGDGDPTVVLLHGVPVHAQLWRAVIPIVGRRARVVALDLVGCGASDKPLELVYDLDTQCRYYAGALEALGVGRHVLVAMDLGLIVGLQHAMNRPRDLLGLVAFEGFVQPVEETLANQPLSSRWLMAAMGWRWFAERALVHGGDGVAAAVKLGTARELADGELDLYREPWADPAVRRKVWLEGIGPHTLSPRSDAGGELRRRIRWACDELASCPAPKVLLVGDPGAAVTPKTVELAQQRLPGLEVIRVGSARHFIPEDQPAAVGQAVVDLLQRLGAVADEGAA